MRAPQKTSTEKSAPAESTTLILLTGIVTKMLNSTP